MLKSKIDRACVTDVNIDYEGSITDEEARDFIPKLVHVDTKNVTAKTKRAVGTITLLEAE